MPLTLRAILGFWSAKFWVAADVYFVALLIHKGRWDIIEGLWVLSSLAGAFLLVASCSVGRER